MTVSSHGGRTTGGRLPRGPHQLTTTQVADDQRLRLIDAMVKLAGENGYAATTVADIIKHAAVSRKTFYEHFADREALLLASFDATSPAALEEARTASQHTGGPTRQIEGLMKRLCRLAHEHPNTIALSTIEIAAIDPEGLERHDRLMSDYGELIDRCLRGGDKKPVLPSTLARALASGVHRTIDSRLRTGQGEELPAISSQLARWTRSYHPVPPTLEREQEQIPSWIVGDEPTGGRAPGTLTLSPMGYEPPRLANSHGFVHHANRERILDAVARLTSVHGYIELTASSIAEEADLSERAFLAHFKNKDEAFSTAVEVGHAKGQAIVERARASASDWRTGVRNGVSALLEFLASEPYFTRLAFVDAPLAGPAMARRTHEHVGAYARLLLDGAPQRRRPPEIAPEAIMQGFFELAFHQAAQHKVAELTRLTGEATYLALAPYVGVTETGEIVSAGHGS